MKEVINSIPEKTGVYFFKNRDDEIIYIGKSICLKKRITDHFRDGSNKIFIKVERENVNPKNSMPMDTWDYTAKYLEKIPSLVFNKERKKKNQIKGSTEKIDYIVTDSEEEALTLEGCLISAIRPHLNRMMWKYPFIEITLGEAIPRVLTAYQILDPNSYIYGPFNIAADIDLAIDGFL
ncbi:MAG: GIY-YIG nuclease family protein, partial [Candidatus Heimdallarchaeota archaeon]